MNEVVAGNPINFLDQARSIFVVDGRSESTHKPPTPSCQLPLAVMRLLPPLIVVSALLGGCNTTGSLPSTGSSEPGADEAADPASTLLLVADPALPLLEALGFPSKQLVVMPDHAERGVGRCGAGVWAGAGASLCLHVHKDILMKRNPKKQKEQRTKNEQEQKSRYFWAVSSVRDTFSPVSSIGVTFWAISSVGGSFWAVSSVGGTVWTVSKVGGTLWAVLGVGGTFWRYLELTALF